MELKRQLLTLALAAPGLLMSQTPVWDNDCHPDVRETYAVAFSTDGAKVLSGSECDNAYVRLWDTPTGDLLWEADAGPALMCLVGVQFSASGSHFAVMEELGNVLIYDYSGTTPVLAHTIDMGISASYSLDFSPDNAKVVADGTGGTLRIYDVASGALVQSIPGNNGAVFTVDWSPEGSLIAAGSQDNNVRLWNAADGTLAATLTGHGNDIKSVKFNASGDHVVTASANGQVKLWMNMMGSWMVHASFTVPETIQQVDISDDDRYIILGGQTTTHIYDAMSGDPVATFNVTGGGRVWSVDFKPGGYDAVTGTSSGRVVYWGLESLLSVPETQAIAFEVFPNPTANAVSISLPEVDANTTAEIFTSAGQLMRTERITSTRATIGLAELASGEYLLRVRSGSGVGIRSITKN